MTTATRVVIIFISLLFNVGAISAIENYIYTSSSSDCTLTEENYRLPNHVVPQSYAIRLSMYLSAIDGNIDIIIEILNETSEISLNAYKLHIDSESVKLTRFRTIERHGVMYIPTGYRYCHKPQVLFLTFDKILIPGIYKLEMNYTAVIQTNRGFVRTVYEEINNEQKVYEWSYITLLDQTGARRVFPCWDEPTFKAIFNITVVHWSKEEVFSNMPYRRNTEMENWNMETEFEPTPVIASYLVLIAIITFDQTSTSENRIWFRSEKTNITYELLQTVVNKTKDILIRYTGNMWENSTTKIVAYPNLPTKAVGSGELAIFRENELLSIPEIHFPGRVIEIWKMIANEMARQCIETYVSPTEWSHVWFSKTLGLYIGYNILEEIFEDKEPMMQHFVVQILQPALHNDDILNVPSVIQEYDQIYSILIYKKASALIKMMEDIVTKDVLEQAIAEYVETYAYRTATPNDFFRIVDSKMNQSEEEYQYNITKFIHTWLSRRKYPTLLVTRHYDIKYTNITYNDTEHTSEEQDKWMIPVTYAKRSDPRFDQKFPQWWLDENNTFLNPTESLNGDADEWILLNVQHSGYYRVNYDNKNWQYIAHFLSYKNHQEIHVLNRAQILDDAYHFLMDDKMDYNTYSTLIEYLKKETNFVVWHSMMNVLQYMSPFFKFVEGQYFKERMLCTIHEVMTQIGYDEDPNDDVIDRTKVHALRMLLLKWSCQHGHSECRKNANYKLAAHINDSQAYPTLPGWRDWTYCAGLMKTNETIWNEVMRSIARRNDSEMLQHLACNDNDDMIKELLKWIAIEPSNEWLQLKEVHLRKLYHAIVKKHARKNKVLDFLLENFNRIFPRNLSKLQILVDIIMSVYSKCQLDKIWTSVKKNPLDDKTSGKVREIIALRLNQTNKQKDMFIRRFPYLIYAREC